jgi:hypothetical protein
MVLHIPALLRKLIQPPLDFEKQQFANDINLGT